MKRSPKTVDERRERSSDEARALTEADKIARVEKTERLRAQRLAQESKNLKSRGKARGRGNP